MRAVIQRVKRASVSINDLVKADIKTGLLIFLGIGLEDNDEDINWLTNKIVNLRIFDDQNGMMNLSIIDLDAEAMIISQFTLHAQTKKGNRPSYNKAASQELAVPIYKKFIKQMECHLPGKISSGIFGANMKVDLTNNGPVTIIIDTKNRE